MTRNRLQWIHLSDLHINVDDQFDRSVVLPSLWRDIENLVSKGLQPDFIAFTGDVAYHGREEEYELAEKEFFQPLGGKMRKKKLTISLRE
jgi:3',5'-cyclic AMP phosphodiesterase CpdA